MSDVLNETPNAPGPRRWKPLLIGLALGLVVGGGAVFLVRPTTSTPHAAEGKAQTWQCPMHPQIMQDHEGDCPICGMDLVPMTGAQALESPGPEGLVTVQIDAQRRQLMGLRTAVLVSDPLHLRRAIWMADDLGIAAVSSPTPTTRYRSLKTKLRFLRHELYYWHHDAFSGG